MFPEVRLGLVPSVIGTYVLAAIGERYARRYLLTLESFDASEAYRIGTGIRSGRTGYTGRDDKLALRAVAARRTVRAGGYRKFITVAARREQDAAPRDKSVLQIATAEAREGVAAHLRERPRLG
ncbi:MAG: hypothetical protein H7X91_08625 [Burkholderiales bacterium]|nr:hypothetical protein [Burkholderiales bacterium]